MTPAANKNTLAFARLLLLLIAAAIVSLAYIIWQTVHSLQNTGTLQVTVTYASDATLSISQPNHQAKLLGTGSAKVRLHPGTYLVMAKSAGKQAAQSVKITQGHTTAIKLNPAPIKAPPSINTAGFINFDTLVTNGLSSSQLTNLEQLFLSYKQSAQVFTVNPASVSPGPHDPNSDDPSFSLTFTGTIDSTPYAATVRYVGFENVVLVLTDPQTGAQLFSGSAPSSADT